MNSADKNIENQELLKALFSHEEKIISLEKKISTLNKICNEINPYQEIPLEMKNQLNQFGILEFSNPFQVTNTLITLLEDAINELHQYKPFDEHESES